MLRSFLRIDHLAVIDAVQVEFEPGLNVLTGETGAGKSMLVEAVGLLMGGRASADLIRTGETQAHVRPSSMRHVVLAFRPATLIVRRDINAQGRSRAFVNDTLVTAASLSEQTSPLVELHGQHEHQTLLDPQSHLLMLDEFAGLVACARAGRRRIPGMETAAVGVRRVSDGRARKSGAARSAEVPGRRARDSQAASR